MKFFFPEANFKSGIGCLGLALLLLYGIEPIMKAVDAPEWILFLTTPLALMAVIWGSLHTGTALGRWLAKRAA